LYAALRARGWELRRTSALEQAAPVTFAEPLAFDSAPAVPLSETGYTMWPSLRPQFWIPVFENAGPTGRFGGALTAGTDALGRFAYATDLFVSPEPFRAEGDFALVCSALGNPTLDVSAWASWTDLGRPPSAPTVTVSELDHYAALGASFVTRRWRSLASLRVAAELERTRYAAIPDTALAAGAPNGPLGMLFRVGGVAPQGVNVFFAPTLSATRAFPLRGYASGELRGQRAAAGSVEYRVPLALVGRALGHLPVGVDRVWLNLFADAGDAWAPGASPRLTRLRSAGVELASRMTVSYDFPLSVRL